jgi:hypothetical protein
MTTLPPKDRLAQVRLQGVLRRNDHETDEREADRRWHLAAGLMMITLGLSVSVFTNANVMYQGLLAEMERSAGVSFDNTLNTLLVTATITLLSWITWYTVFHFGPRMRIWWASILSYLAAIAFTAVTIVASSFLNFQGLTHLITRPMYMVDASNRSAEIVDTLTVATATARGVLPGLEAIKSDACAQAQGETNSGLASGTGGGFGPAASAFTSICAGVDSLIVRLESDIADAEIKATRLSAILEKLLRTVDDRRIPLLEREDAFKAALAELDSVMRAYRNRGLGKGVKGGVGTLRNLVVKVDDTAGIQGGAQVVINSLRDKLEGSAAALEKVLASQMDLASYERARKVSLTEISFIYGWQFPSQMAIAAFLDVWPLAIYSFGLLIAVRSARPKRRARFADELRLERHIPDELLTTQNRRKPQDEKEEL